MGTFDDGSDLTVHDLCLPELSSQGSFNRVPLAMSPNLSPYRSRCGKNPVATP